MCNIPDQHANPHFRSQHTFIDNGDGNILADYIGKFERLDHDFEHICTETGIAVMSLPRLMVGGNRIDYKEFYT